MQVTSFRFDPDLIAEFVEFGDALYLDDPRRITPFHRAIARQLSPAYPFYSQAGNDHRLFIVRRGSEVVGRTAAMVNGALRDDDGHVLGLIGFFECVQDPVAANVLLDAACDWLRAEHGVRRIWGPMNFDIWHGYRFMTQGFDEEPFFGEPSNKPWYPQYFERYGFKTRRTWNSLEIRGRDRLEALVSYGRAPYEAALERGYRFVSGEHWDRRGDMPLLHLLVSRVFQGFLGYTPIALEEFSRLYRKQWTTLARPMSFFMFDAANRPMGFAVTYYELSAAIRAMRGRENPLSKARFMIGRRHVRRLNLFAAGGIPEAQGTSAGLGSAALYYIVDQALQHGFDDIIFALMATDSRVQTLFRHAEIESRREYALYELRY
jgi:hypothetical protein